MNDAWFSKTEVFLLHEIVARLNRLAQKRVLEPEGVSYAEFLVALAVQELGEPTQSEVCDWAEMSKSVVSQRVATLLAKGLVEQRREMSDRRQVRLALTPLGQETLAAMCRQLAGNASKLFDLLGPGRDRFRQSLFMLRQALIDEEAQPDGALPVLRASPRA
jgi:DNA-binding MarR family transcriptional regulator